MSTARIKLKPTSFGYRWGFPSMGTRWDIQIAGATERQAVELVGRTVRWCVGFEQRYSRFKPESWLSQVNARAGTGEWTALTASDEELLNAAMSETQIVFETSVDTGSTWIPLSPSEVETTTNKWTARVSLDPNDFSCLRMRVTNQYLPPL